MHVLLAFLSRDWSGLAIAAVVGVVGLGLVLGGRRGASRTLVWSGSAIVGLAGVLAIGASYQLAYMMRIRAAHPPPGEMVDVGGYRMHLLAQGDAAGRPAIVWIPGSHGAGYALYHLHAAMRSEARSILIDRPGSGWSDAGPFPRTTPREVEEIVLALRGAGERGPFIFAGHSFGGLLAANIARRYPELTAAVVLIDATPPDALNYCPPNPFIDDMFREATVGAVQRAFGIHAGVAERLWPREDPPEYQRVRARIESELGEAGRVMKRIEDSPRALAASRSIFEELRRGGLGWNETVYDGDLEDQRVYLVAPPRMAEFATVAERMLPESGSAQDQNQREARRLMRFYENARERYMRTSTRAVRVYAPEGSGHNFPYEHPDFVIRTLREIVADAAGSQAP